MDFIPIKQNNITFKTIDELLDELYDEEKRKIHERLSVMNEEKENLKEEYKGYYSKYSLLIKEAFESKQKKYGMIIQSLNEVWSERDEIKINPMLKLAMETIKNELIVKGYKAEFLPKYISGQNSDDCRGCSDYIGYYEFIVVF